MSSFRILAAAIPLVLAACVSSGDPEASGETAGNESSQGEAASETATVEGSASSGEGIFRRCAACHSVEPGERRVGPSLHGVYGRDVASADGFSYSAALQAVEGSWNDENLDGYLASPAGFAPGTSMSFAGIPNEQDRADLIAYLETLR